MENHYSLFLLYINWWFLFFYKFLDNTYQSKEKKKKTDIIFIFFKIQLFAYVYQFFFFFSLSDDVKEGWLVSQGV